MNEKLGIESVQELLDFGFALKGVGADLFKDGKFHPESLGELLPLYPKVLAVIQDSGKIIPELKDLDESEGAQLVSFIVSKGIASEHAGDVINKSLNVAIAVIHLVKSIQA